MTFGDRAPGAGVAGYFGYRAWSNRLPSWLSDESIERFLESEGVPAGEIGADAAADVTTDVAGDLVADASIASLREALAGGFERLGIELLLFDE